MSYGSIMPLGTHRKEECHQDKPLFGISSGRESGTVSGVVTGWWGLLEILVRDKEAGGADRWKALSGHHSVVMHCSRCLKKSRRCLAT